MDEVSRIFIILALIAAVIILVTANKKAVDASTLAVPADLPVDGGGIADDENAAPFWALNKPRALPMPLALMAPRTGTQPVDGSNT